MGRSRPSASASSLTPPSRKATSISGRSFCWRNLASVVFEVPISGTTFIPVALVYGSAMQVWNASPQFPPYQATRTSFDCAKVAPQKREAAKAVKRDIFFEINFTPLFHVYKLAAHLYSATP